MYSLFLLYIQVCNLFQILFTVTFDFTLNFSAVVFNSLFSKSFEDLDVLFFPGFLAYPLLRLWKTEMQHHRSTEHYLI